jgi:predicted nuclease of predicted toxin-antitoxin system
MRVLLDECVPAQVRNALPDHEVATAQLQGWGGLSNGELLDVAEKAGFEVFVVADKNLRYQQNLTNRRIAILELWTNHRPTLEKCSPAIHAAVDRIKPGEYLILDQP